MSHHLQAEENAIQTDEWLQLPQMVVVAADLTRYLLDSDLTVLRTAKQSLYAPNS